METLILVLVGGLVGLTTVLFGFGGGFVTVPIVSVVDSALGGDAIRVATATSALVMLVNAAVATASTRRNVLGALHGRAWLFALLAIGGGIGATAGRWAPDLLLRWGFVGYVGITVVDLLARPGFFRPSSDAPQRDRLRNAGMRTWLGLPIGAVAAFLGVGGSVMTVPMMRRAGASMQAATALANPLTLAIVTPAIVVTLFLPGHVRLDGGLIGAVDVRTALALLGGAMPIIIALRRRPPRIPESIHAGGYVALLVAAGTVVALS